MSFAYNADGLRTSKTVNSITTSYYYSGSQLIAEETDGDITLYIYDASGMVIGFEFYESDDTLNSDNAWDIYWYEKNLQGEQVKIS